MSENFTELHCTNNYKPTKVQIAQSSSSQVYLQQKMTGERPAFIPSHSISDFPPYPFFQHVRFPLPFRSRGKGSTQKILNLLPRAGKGVTAAA